jgi:KipI family sensor histidine kinase inhibitor
MPTRLLPMGLEAVLDEDPPGEPAAWARGVRVLAIDGVVVVVPAARTVLIRCVSAGALTAVRERLDAVQPQAADSVAADVTIAAVYDGEDLGEIADATGLSVETVIGLHSSAEYRVAFCGFAPGFGYLTGLPLELHLPRRASPRTRVPAGSVAIAAEYSAVYPRSSPGGWHLIGRTDAVLFDVERHPPALLAPGTTVRFVVA